MIPVAELDFAVGASDLAALADASIDGMALLALDGRCLYVNTAACGLFHADARDLAGSDFTSLFSPADRAILRAHISCLGSGEGISWSSILRDAGGVERSLECRLRRSSHDESVLVAVVRDVSETRELVRRTNAVARIAASMAYAGTIAATLHALARTLVEVTGLQACTIFLLGDDGKSSMSAIYGMPDDVLDRLHVIWGEGASPLSTAAVEEGKTVIIRDVPQALLRNPRFASIYDYLEVAPWDTLVAVPLLYGGRSLGILTGHYSPSAPPGTADIAFLNIIAHQTAVALENARLYEQAQKTATLEERQRLARELHDSVSQALFGIGLGARTARTLLERDPAQAIESMDYVLSLTQAGMAEMRALIFELRPESLENEGLVSALEKQAAALRARYELRIDTVLCDEPDVPLPVKEALYRITQEALHNTVKHADAESVRVSLRCTAGEVIVHIEDDGGGFDSSASFPGHLGLHSMQERAARVGGTVELESEVGRGTRVRVRVPSADAGDHPDTPYDIRPAPSPQ